MVWGSFAGGERFSSDPPPPEGNAGEGGEVPFLWTSPLATPPEVFSNEPELEVDDGEKKGSPGPAVGAVEAAGVGDWTAGVGDGWMGTTPTGATPATGGVDMDGKEAAPSTEVSVVRIGVVDATVVRVLVRVVFVGAEVPTNAGTVPAEALEATGIDGPETSRGSCFGAALSDVTVVGSRRDIDGPLELF